MKFINSVGKGANGIVHYVFTVIAVIAGYFIGQLPMTMVLMYRMYTSNEYGKEQLEEFSQNPDFAIFNIDRNFGFLLILFTFIGALAALYLAIKYLHKRSFYSLISFDEKIDWKRIFWSTGIWFLMLLVVEIGLIIAFPDIYTFHDPEISFLILLPVVLLVLPLQTAFEELFVRGYIFQAVSFNSRSILLGFIISIAVFATLHGANPEIAKYGIAEMMTYYILAGILLGIIVIFDDRLELAIGVHTATNMFGALFVTYKGAAIQTDSLFVASSVNPLLQAFEFLILGVIFIFIAKCKYKWDFNSLKSLRKNV